MSHSSGDAQDPDGPSGDGGGPNAQGLLRAVPLFPLPNVVLFPRAVLPLHIFEERYKLMTAHALAGERLVAMALLKPGWEKNYYHKPAIEPVVCVGMILTHEKLPDGKYNFLLQGQSRARVMREVGDLSYRMADLQTLPEEPVLEIDLGTERTRLTRLFERGPFAATSIGKQFRRMLDSAAPTTDIADLIAFNYLEDVAVKQALLAETDVRRRVGRTIEALEAIRPPTQVNYFGLPTDPSLN